MIPQSGLTLRHARRFPRVSGDEPVSIALVTLWIWFSPREWGSARILRRRVTDIRVFPA